MSEEQESFNQTDRPVDRDPQPANLVELHPATETDFEFAKNVFVVANRDVMKAQYGEWNQAEQDKKFQEVWDDKGSKIQIVTVEGNPSGFIQVEEFPDVLWLHELALLPEVQRKGIGSNLVGRVQETAKQQQVPVRLNVLRKNPAIKLYKSLGFESIEDEEDEETYTKMIWRPSSEVGEEQGSMDSRES